MLQLARANGPRQRDQRAHRDPSHEMVAVESNDQCSSTRHQVYPVYPENHPPLHHVYASFFVSFYV
jgi:hypothetical protein